MLGWRRGNRSVATTGQSIGGQATGGPAAGETAERPATEALIPRSLRRHYPKVIMTLVLGLDEATLGPLLREMAEADAPNDAPHQSSAAAAAPRASSSVASMPVRRALEPVLVTDCMNFALFRDAGLIFEYLPGPAVRARYAPAFARPELAWPEAAWPEAAWDVYISRRLERLRHKWAPVRIVAIGAVARDVLARQLASPFAADDLADLIGGSRPPEQSMLSIERNKKG